jgi:rod shape-determining protein MreC
MRRLTRRQRTSALVLAVIAVALVALDLGGSGLRSAHSGVRGTLGALYRGTDSALSPMRRFLQGIPSAGSNQDTISALRHDNADLRGQLAAAQADRTTAAQLRALQVAANRGGYSVLPARVIAFGPGAGFDWTVTLDVGTSSGVRVDQTVTDGADLVGRVLHADRSSSVVLLAADPQSGVGVRDLRTGQLGVATGQGTHGFTLVPLDPNTTLEVGDRIATGPAGSSSFAAGLAVGTVTSIRRTTSGPVEAIVAASSSPTSLDLVGVILVGGQPVTRAPLTPSSSGPSVAAQGGR